MKKLLVIALCILTIVSLFGCHKKTDTNTDEETNTTVKIIYSNEEHTVRNEGGKLKYYINNKFKNNIDNRYTHDNYIDLRELEIVEEQDISKLSLVTDNMYSSDLDKSSGYIKLLENNGYSMEFEAYTPKFIELYMRNNDVLKRIIITKDYIITKDVESIGNFDIRNYLYE